MVYEKTCMKMINLHNQHKCSNEHNRYKILSVRYANRFFVLTGALVQYFENCALRCRHVLYKPNVQGSPLPYWPSMHLLYNKAKSAILLVAIGLLATKLALPFLPLFRKRKSENP